MTDPADTPSAPSPLRPRRWFGLVFWSCWIGFFAWLWPHSFSQSHALAAYTRDGSIQGVLVHQGKMLFVATTLSFGRDKALTTEHAVATTKEGDWLFDNAFTNASTSREFLGFGYSAGKPGDLPVPTATWAALLLPAWVFVAAGGLSLSWHLYRFVFRTRDRRRRKQGLCLNCGYDLRGSPGGRCPECGVVAIPG